MDNTTLEKAIREESARAIAAIGEKEILELRRMDEAYAAELEKFRKQAEAETETRLQQELSKLENKAVLERKKFGLQSVEQFINRTVDDVVHGLRENSEYKQFLLSAIKRTAEKIPANIEVSLKRDDLAWAKEIHSIIPNNAGNRKVVIKEDPGIQWGGCLILEEAEGRVFNNTIERIYFRRSLLIRQKVMDILREHAGNDRTFESPAVRA